MFRSTYRFLYQTVGQVKGPQIIVRVSLPRRGIWLTAACGLWVAVSMVAAQAMGAVTFTNVTTEAGIVHPVNTLPLTDAAAWIGGAAAGDYDGDGWVDIFFPGYETPGVLYRNRQDGTFADVSIDAGFTSLDPGSGSAWGDIDNDGDLDLYLSGMDTHRNFLYINDGDGHFTEQAVVRGADVPTLHKRNSMGVAVGDYDRDGYLDILTSEWFPLKGDTSRLLRNRGAAEPGAFEDVTAVTGVDQQRGFTGLRFTPQFTDLDRNGQTDILFAADYQTSQLFWNQADGSFMDGTRAAGVGTDRNGMGSAVADYDGDGDLDWFVTAIYPINDPQPESGNRLYINNGDRTFTDGTDFAGVRDTGWGWGTSFFDYDNDGDLDLMATNGSYDDHLNDPTALFDNNGDGTFTEVTTLRGISDTDQGRGLLHLDYDNDGDLDVLIVNQIAPPVLYRNDGGNANHYLRVQTQGTASNPEGVGAFIEVTVESDNPGDMMLREIDGGSSFLSQHQKTAHFGLADHDGTVDKVKIIWPSGLVQLFHDVPADSLLQAVEPLIVAIAGDTNNDEQVTGSDLIMVQMRYGDSGAATGLLMGDADGDGFVSGVDLISVQQNYGTVLVSSIDAAVPEPTMLTLLATIAGCLAGRPDRKKVRLI